SDDEDPEPFHKNRLVNVRGKKTVIRRLGLNKEETTELMKTNPTNFHQVLSKIIANYTKLTEERKQDFDNLATENNQLETKNKELLR
ncbi:22977_t:CDS:2, partial [Gigaspora rosea]